MPRHIGPPAASSLSLLPWASVKNASPARLPLRLFMISHKDASLSSTIGAGVRGLPEVQTGASLALLRFLLAGFLLLRHRFLHARQVQASARSKVTSYKNKDPSKHLETLTRSSVVSLRYEAGDWQVGLGDLESGASEEQLTSSKRIRFC